MANETEAPDLLPCPFCGGAPVDFEAAKMVRCADANCPCGQRWASRNKWNTRADLSDAQAARIAELEAKLAKAVDLAADFHDIAVEELQHKRSSLWPRIRAARATLAELQKPIATRDDPA